MDDVLGGEITATRRPVDVYPPDADVPNGQGLDTDEINEGLAILREIARKAKRKL